MIALFALCLHPPVGVFAQTEDDAANDRQVNPLAAKQEMIRDRIRRLEDRMFRLREKLAETEPDSAAKLANALDRMGQVGLEQKTAVLIEMLASDAQLARAADLQGDLVAELHGVLEVLLEQGDPEATRERIERLEKHREDIRALLEEQARLRRQTGEMSAAQALSELAERVGELARRQAATAEAIKQAGGSAEAAAQAQRKVADDTQLLAEELRQAAESLENQQAKDAAAQAAEELGAATDAMSEAEAKLQDGNRAGAESSAKKAADALERARHRLAEQAEQLERENRDGQSGDAAAAQHKASESAEDLAKRMQGGQQSRDGESQEQAPGAENVQQAQQRMQGAAEDLDEKKSGDAMREQDEAIEELQEAEEKLAEELQQLRQEQQQELLSDLRSRLADMLARQEAVNARTVELGDRNRRLAEVDEAAWPRAERLEAAKLSDEQRQIAESAETCLHILEEEGTTIVFPSIVEQVAGDMNAVADRIGGLLLDTETIELQREIVTTLREFVEAVKRMQDEQPQQQQQGEAGQSDENPPLLPGSAELKLLRSAQVRINARTKRIDERRQEAGSVPSDLHNMTDELADRQRSVADLARELRDRTNNQ